MKNKQKIQLVNCSHLMAELRLLAGGEKVR